MNMQLTTVLVLLVVVASCMARPSKRQYSRIGNKVTTPGPTLTGDDVPSIEEITSMVDQDVTSWVNTYMVAEDVPSDEEITSILEDVDESALPIPAVTDKKRSDLKRLISAIVSKKGNKVQHLPTVTDKKRSDLKRLISAVVSKKGARGMMQPTPTGGMMQPTPTGSMMQPTPTGGMMHPTPPPPPMGKRHHPSGNNYDNYGYGSTPTSSYNYWDYTMDPTGPTYGYNNWDYTGAPTAPTAQTYGYDDDADDIIKQACANRWNDPKGYDTWDMFDSMRNEICSAIEGDYYAQESIAKAILN